MSRQARLDLPDLPQHVIQRGNDRIACFRDDVDRHRYLHALGEVATSSTCALHAYVLMTNHVHLLVTPSETGAVARLMQGLGRRYVAYFNRRHERTGTLWEGRYKSCLVDCDRYLLACYRYIELNPVRAGLTQHPRDYGWSSHRANSGTMKSPLLTPHPTYVALGATDEERFAAYRALFDMPVPVDLLEEIRRYTQQQRALGSRAFQRLVATKLSRCATTREAHRPATRKAL